MKKIIVREYDSINLLSGPLLCAYYPKDEYLQKNTHIPEVCIGQFRF